MIIEIPFIYDAKVIPPRARNPRAISVIDRLALNIREVKADDLPVIARYAEWFAEVRGQAVSDIRSDGRRCYRPYAADGGETCPAEMLDARAQDGGNTPFRDHQRLWTCLFEVAVRHGEHAGRHVSDDRRERVARLIEVASRLVVCNGQVLEACGEPAWLRRQGWAFEAALVSPELMKREPGALIRADRLAEEAARYPHREPELRGTIELLRPDMLTLSVELPALLHEAARAADMMGGGIARSVPTTSVREFTVYATLRDAVANAPRGEMTEELALAIDGAIEGLGKDSPLGRRLEEARARWRKELANEPGVDNETPKVRP